MSNTRVLSKEIYDIIKKLKNLYDNKEKDANSDVLENLGEIEKNCITGIKAFMDKEYEKINILALEKDTELETLSFIEDLLQTRDGVNNILYRIQNIVEMDNDFLEIEDTVMFFYDKASKEICKQAVFEKFNGDIENLSLYWEIYTDIKDIESKLEPLL